MFVISCGSKGYIAENSYTPFIDFAKKFETYIMAVIAAGNGYEFQIINICQN